ncbi:MAG: methyltransferase domain-containing protein [Candidatus Thermoplasmatota archaeon]|nr:methyltransferase domain-containing protein [Candidatus Thermoplasmatota archaeon]
MNNGTREEVVSQFNRIAKLPDFWDHNLQYHKYLLKQIKEKRRIGIDIGCGTGELTNTIAMYCERVVGIDVAAGMIHEAQKRKTRENVYFQNMDVQSFFTDSKDTFDVIISVATFHHLDMEEVLGLLKSKLSRNGIILILDLYKTDSLFEHGLSLLAAICNPFIYLVKRGSLRNTKEEREAWNDHFQYDYYSTIEEIRGIAKRSLGKVKTRRHLFWRYSLVYKKSGDI